MGKFTILSKISLLIVFFCLSFSLFFFINETVTKLLLPMITSEDGYARLASGVAYASDIVQARDYIWPPLTKIVYGIPVIYFPQNHFLSARMLAWMLIVATAIFTGLLTHRLTKSLTFSVLAFSLAITNPVNIILSLQTLSENIWVLTLAVSLWLLGSPHKKEWTPGYIFWGLSQACRYESWYLTPLALLYFWFLHRDFKATRTFLISSIIFPTGWLVMTVVDTKNIHFYLDEKMNQAAHGPPEIYHNLKASFNVWYKQLDKTFIPQFTLIFILGFLSNLRKKNLLFLFPVFIFVSLVFQVYIATMEFFPIRYLAILPLTTIPPTVYFIYSLKVHQLLKVTLIALIFTISIQTVHFKITENTDSVPKELIEISPIVAASTSPCITYVKDTSTYINYYSAFWYFSQKPVYAINLIRSRNPLIFDYYLRADCFTIVIEKNTRNQITFDQLPSSFGKPIFENKMFRVYEPPQMKAYVQSHK